MTIAASLPVDEVIQGDCLEVLARLPEKSVDLVFADPPYNLQLQADLFRPNMTKVDAVNDAWDQFSSFAAYDTFTRAWLAACRRVLKDEGTLWVIGSYHNIYRVGTALMDLDYWLLNDVAWIKCLAGNTELFVTINDRPIVTTVKDLLRIDLTDNKIELPSYDEQGRLTHVEITGWQKTEKSRGLRLEMEDGSTVTCSANHRFPVARAGQLDMVEAAALSVGDTLLQLAKFDIPTVVASEAMDKDMGEFVGWYLAEGSTMPQDKGLTLSMGADERGKAEWLIELIQRRLGVVGRIHIYGNSLHLIFPGRHMVAYVERFVRGRGSKHKRLAREAFQFGADFLHGVLNGYLQGDAHWDERNQRWRLGLTRNEGLLTDLSVICRLLGFRLHTALGYVPYQRGQAEIIRGEIRANTDSRWSFVTLETLGLPSRRSFSVGQGHSSAAVRDRYKLVTRKNPIGQMPPLAEQVLNGDLRPIKIKSIAQSTQRMFYELSVSGNHVFALANGLLTHNSNPMPNFRGARFTNAHETLIWAQKVRGAHYTFNYQGMKALNEDLQMRSDWYLSLCTGKERLKINGAKAHPTQKPEALLYRVILASTRPGDVILDPFFGTGTTGAVAKTLHRHWIGVEREARYTRLARERIEAVQPSMFSDEVYAFDTHKREPRLPFGTLLEHGLLRPGQTLYFGPKAEAQATVLANGLLSHNGATGSIHAIGRAIRNAPCNGWEHWYYEEAATGELLPINVLRAQLRQRAAEAETDSAPGQPEASAAAATAPAPQKIAGPPPAQPTNHARRAKAAAV